MHLSPIVHWLLFPSYPHIFRFLSLQRFVIIANNDTIETVIIEEDSGKLAATEASKVLAQL